MTSDIVKGEPHQLPVHSTSLANHQARNFLFTVEQGLATLTLNRPLRAAAAPARPGARLRTAVQRAQAGWRGSRTLGLLQPPVQPRHLAGRGPGVCRRVCAVRAAGRIGRGGAAVRCRAGWRYRAAWQRDQGESVTREAAMAKLTATETEMMHSWTCLWRRQEMADRMGDLRAPLAMLVGTGMTPIHLPDIKGNQHEHATRR